MTDRHDNRRRRRTGRRILYLCLAVAIALPPALYVRARGQWASRVDRRKEAMKAAGLPTSFVELTAWYRLPDGAAGKAAGYYLDAFACYSRPNDLDANQVPLAGTGQLPGRAEALAAQTRQAMARFVAANSQALDLLHEAAGIQACRYPSDFKKGLAAATLWLSKVRPAGGLLGCDAILQAECGQPALACRSIESGLRLADSLAAEPVLVSQLVGIANRLAILSNLERIMTRTELPLECLLSMDRVLAAAEDANAVARGMVGESVFIMDFLEHPTQEMSASLGGSAGTSAPLGLYAGLGLAQRDEAEYLEIVTASADAMKLPCWQRLPALRAIDGQLQRIPASHVLFHMVAPGVAGCCEIELRSLAQIRAARTALAVERYRLKTGGLAPALDSLVPDYLAAPPVDPFKGELLKYRQLAKGYVVYSVGPNLVDDGGRERGPKSEEPYDVTFIVER